MKDLKVYYALEDDDCTLAVFLDDSELPKYTTFTLRESHSVASPSYILELKPATSDMYEETHTYLANTYADSYFGEPFHLVPASRDEFKAHVEKQ